MAKEKKYYECQVCHNVIYYSKRHGWRCGVGCDKAVKGKEIKMQLKPLFVEFV